MSEEEIEDRREFIRCYLLKDFELLLMIPFPGRTISGSQATRSSWKAPSTPRTSRRSRRPFDKYGYRVKKVMEQVKDLALLHSCISQPEGRKNIQARFEALVESEFREQLLSLVDRYRETFDEERMAELRRKIAKSEQAHP